MTGFRRYGVYFTPPRTGALARFGASWLGRDIATGQTVAHPELPGLPAARIEALTETPRRYGFHATLKPPFRLAPGHSADAVLADLRRICATLAPVSLPQGLQLARFGGFLALIPADPPPPVSAPVSPQISAQLSALSSALVRGLDPHRAPLTRPERGRRHPDRLSPEQRDNLERWGYPWVMQQFRFHMTLTGRLPADQANAAQAALSVLLQPILPVPMAIEAVALVGEDSGGRFHIIEKIKLNSNA